VKIERVDGVFMRTAPDRENEPRPCERLLSHDVNDMAVFDSMATAKPSWSRLTLGVQGCLRS